MKNGAANSNGDGENFEEEEPRDKSESSDPTSTSHAKLYKKLKAVEFEIDAVASTVDHVRRVASKEDSDVDGDGNVEGRGEEDAKSAVEAFSNDLTLQHALAADRLKSLKKTKAQLEKELTNFQDGKTDHEKFIHDLVKEEHRPKRKLKQPQKAGKNISKRLKSVSVDDDADFDSVLDAASAGFGETVC